MVVAAEPGTAIQPQEEVVVAVEVLRLVLMPRLLEHQAEQRFFLGVQQVQA